MDVVGEDTQLYFILSHGRQCNTLNRNYRLPADEDEIRVSTFLVQPSFVLSTPFPPIAIHISQPHD